jgi:hypothetical protein
MEALVLEELNVFEALKNNFTTPCVSVVIPTHKMYPDRAVDALVAKQAFKRAKTQVLIMCPREEGGEEIIEKLGELLENVNFTKSDLGIGFYVSPDMGHVVKFPFVVQEKVIVGNSFEVRDLLYLSEMTISYYVLLINEKEIKLFEGHVEKLKLIKDDHFPLRFYDDYEYSHTSIGSSYGYALKSFEKDKSVVKEQRVKAYLKTADEYLTRYLEITTPLILIGNSKELGYYKKASVNYNNVVGKVDGNYSQESIYRLGNLAFEKIKEYLYVEHDKLINRFDDAYGKKLATYGIINVWRAAKEGKGLILLVEKDYSIPGFVSEDEFELFLSAPKKVKDIIEDAVDDVMEAVLEKKGKVKIVANGKLSKYDGIAMILRYW